MTYTVTQEIKSQAKVFKSIYAFDFLFIVIYLMVSYMLSTIVASPLKAPYYIFSICMVVFLTLPSAFNQKRRNYQTIILLLKRETVVYKPVVIRKERVS
mgnify:CR=1 FL=1